MIRNLLAAGSLSPWRGQSRHRMTTLCLVVMGIVARPIAVTAHDRSTSYSTWEIHGRHARVVGRLTELDLSRFPWTAGAGDNYDRMVGRYLGTHLQLLAGETPCSTLGAPRRLAAPTGRVAYEWKVECPPQGELAIRTRLFLDVAPSHLHFARVTHDASPTRESLLSEAEPQWQLHRSSEIRDAGDPGATATSFGDYVALGIEHILTGYDHLAFVLALLLIGGSLGEVARVVTGFTLAHSITLALTVLGYVQPDNAPVEALIGLSIFLVAAENSWLRSDQRRSLPIAIALALASLALLAARGHGRVPALTLAGLAIFSASYFELLRRLSNHASLRWAIAFLFGLVHGFGFASVLEEAGLASDRIVPALLGFNLGVEFGQLAVVALTWPLLRILLRGDQGSTSRLIVDVTSAAVAGLGLFWFAIRTFG